MTNNKYAIIYSDINLKAGLEPTDVVTNIDAVSQSLLLIFSTPKRSKWFDPEFGCYIAKYLWEPTDDVTANKIRTEIVDALGDGANSERRVKVNKLEVIPDYANSSYYVNLEFSIPTLDLSNKLEFSLAKAA